jgi:2-polyprenyl-6-methoxyphenol hydroxylase-like FAD-dependent oxidoreductase
MSTCCVVVGGGPGGMLLTYLLGAAGLDVTLLEAQPDFDRDFRGDSLHPYMLEMLDQLGLAEELLRLPHYRAEYFRFHTPAGSVTTADYRHIRSRFNFVALMPQVRFLEFMAERLGTLPAARVLTGAKVVGLLRDENGRVTGVRYRTPDGEHVMSAGLVVAAD